MLPVNNIPKRLEYYYSLIKHYKILIKFCKIYVEQIKGNILY